MHYTFLQLSLRLSVTSAAKQPVFLKAFTCSTLFQHVLLRFSTLICRLQVADFPLQQTGTTVGEFADRISALRQKLSGVEDVGIISSDGTINLVTRDSNGIALGRSPQVGLQSPCDFTN